MGTDPNERTTPEYLAQLLKDKKQMQAFPNLFTHTERLLDDGMYVVLCIYTKTIIMSLYYKVYEYVGLI